MEGTLFVDANILIYADLPESAYSGIARQKLQLAVANIVATMQQYGIKKLLTNNVEDFRRFSSLIELIALQPEVKPI